jgi:hypothetical protein
MPSSLKTASFVVKATARQSARWKQAAEGAGHTSVGTWLAEAVDAHLYAMQRAGKPLPLSWERGRRFRVKFQDGEVEVKGWTALPFGIFRGSAAGLTPRGWRSYSLVYVPDGRVLATLRAAKQCRALASDLARLWVRWGGNEPSEDPAPVLDRHQRESV